MTDRLRPDEKFRDPRQHRTQGAAFLSRPHHADAHAGEGALFLGHRFGQAGSVAHPLQQLVHDASGALVFQQRRQDLERAIQRQARIEQPGQLLNEQGKSALRETVAPTE